MIDRSKLENVILVADRGYENYNIFAHAIEKGWKFAILRQPLTALGYSAFGPAQAGAWKQSTGLSPKG